ncbi:class IV lanthionine synthetase LanL [Streptomyces sp. NPDC056661]|uniref:class IV lanthionine synthetase LanL n=1 Tax=Streptomyces sp. NPDC056661 TaxID=3345898 RepID=UPI003683588F
MHDNSDAYVLRDTVRAVIGRHGDPTHWTVTSDDFWCHVQPTDNDLPEQGWKLHVSATVLSSAAVLARVTRIFVTHGCAFKFARDFRAVEQLTSTTCDRGRAGKFVTAYPGTDQLALIAGLLDNATHGLPGPRILSDRQVRPGSLVHYRYGGIKAAEIIDDSGRYVSVLTGPSGEQIVDARKAGFTIPPWTRDPFNHLPKSASRSEGSLVVRIGERFDVNKALRHANRGGVFLATDITTGAKAVIKQARAHVGAGLDGRDARDVLRHEARMLARLHTLGVSARPLEPVIEQQEDCFLALEFLPGQTLHDWAISEAPRDASDGLPVPVALSLARQLVDLLGRVRSDGVVLRDLKPKNVMRLPDGELRLIDLEYAQEAGERCRSVSSHVFTVPSRGLWTTAQPTDDCFSLGVTLLHAVSAATVWALPPANSERDMAAALSETVACLERSQPAVRVLGPMLRGLTALEPDLRWDLSRAGAFLDGLHPGKGAMNTVAGRGSSSPKLGERTFEHLLEQGLTVMVEEIDAGERLWGNGPRGVRYDPVRLAHGAAGLLPVLTQAAAITGGAELWAAAQEVAHWTGARLASVQHPVSGLLSGHAGAAWALHDASDLLNSARLAEQALACASRLPLASDTLDLAGGVAGSGLAQLHLWHTTQDRGFFDKAMACADRVLAAALPGPGEAFVQSGSSHFGRLAGGAASDPRPDVGMAHGAAGAASFLLAAGKAGRADCLAAAVAVAGELVRAAVSDRDGVWWLSTQGQRIEGRCWCNGAAGVGTFLLRVWEHTGDERFLRTAERAAATQARRRWRLPTSACCGLLGLIHFYLLLARSTGEGRHRQTALDLFTVIHTRRTSRQQSAYVLADDPGDVGNPVVAGFGSGLAGYLAVVLSLRHGVTWWMLDPTLALAGSAVPTDGS